MAKHSKAFDEMIKVSQTLTRVVRLETEYSRVGIAALVIAAAATAFSEDYQPEDFDALLLHASNLLRRLYKKRAKKE